MSRSFTDQIRWHSSQGGKVQTRKRGQSAVRRTGLQFKHAQTGPDGTDCLAPSFQGWILVNKILQAKFFLDKIDFSEFTIINASKKYVIIINISP